MEGEKNSFLLHTIATELVEANRFVVMLLVQWLFIPFRLTSIVVLLDVRCDPE
jgi:hypothetical protein